MQKEIEEKNLAIDILLNEHDGALVQCNNTPEEIKATGEFCLRYFQPELTSPRGEKFRMKAELSIGENFGNMKELIL